VEKCLYCHKLWPKRHIIRSALDIYEEMKYYYDHGYRAFSFLDDVFNLDRDNSSRFFDLIIKNQLDVRLLFPNGLRGDILTPDYIDLMSEAGVIEASLALESASPRIQELIHKRIDIERLRENIEYICAHHPQMMIDLQTMYGFPTETEDEVLQTFDFIKSIRWLHFPYLHSLRIFPDTAMAEFAMRHGVSHESIERSVHLQFNEPGATMPFPESFGRQYQADFLRDYFLLPERLEQVLPIQKSLLTREELIAKYDSYLPGGLSNYPEIGKLIGDHGFYQEACRAEH